ncbi:FAD:protein FMN transferase [Dysgonamonadaceae bacterium]|nr:FAD:protein FMN transferase [Dysgonamonadaceae bacterium]
MEGPCRVLRAVLYLFSMNTDYSHYYDASSLFHGSLLNIMGTRLDAVFIETDKALCESVWQKTVAELLRLDKMFNRFDIESEIYSVNLRAPTERVVASDELMSVLISCKRYHLLSLGLFDVTLSDFDAVDLDTEHQTISFSEKNVSIDFGACAKGYALDKVKQVLVEADIKDALIDFGNSSVLALGHHPFGDCWKISVENPFRPGEIVDEIELRDVALSISGNMPTHLKHIVNPRTHQFIEDKKIVSIIAQNSFEAEILSTALMIANHEEQKKILSHFDHALFKEYIL